MRLFLALKPDRPAEAQLARRLLQVQERLGDLAGALRWVPAENIHITLHFLGEVDAGRVAQLQEGLGVSIDEPPFDVTIGDVGVFPASGPPRVVWLDIAKGQAPLARVHAELGRRLGDAGFALETRPLSPHLTVARVPDRQRGRVARLRERLEATAPAPVTWSADHVLLCRSDLSGPVPRYEALQAIALGRVQ